MTLDPFCQLLNLENKDFRVQQAKCEVSRFSSVSHIYLPTEFGPGRVLQYIQLCFADRHAPTRLEPGGGAKSEALSDVYGPAHLSSTE